MDSGAGNDSLEYLILLKGLPKHKHKTHIQAQAHANMLSIISGTNENFFSLTMYKLRNCRTAFTLRKKILTAVKYALFL